jgi:murein DD-endopeptidase MepM/ murein hydrolase activator NlpD
VVWIGVCDFAGSMARMLVCVALVAAGCFGGSGGFSGDGNQMPLDENAPYRLPWACGATFDTSQGNGGDLCGWPNGDHVGLQQFAFDFAMPRGTAVRAARAGVVTLAVSATEPGARCFDGCPDSATFEECCRACLTTSNHVNVEHDDGTVATYWHFDEVLVAVGARVVGGDVLGRSGTSGCSTGPHLHFEVMQECPQGFCQSMPAAFAEAGRPTCGDPVTSHNACR